MASQNPIQPVDTNRFANGKYCSANLPLTELLTKNVSKAMSQLEAKFIARKAAIGKGKPKEISNPEARRIQQRVVGEQVKVHDTIERTLEVLILILDENNPQIRACVKQIHRCLNVSMQAFDIFRKIEELD